MSEMPLIRILLILDFCSAGWANNIKIFFNSNLYFLLRTLNHRGHREGTKYTEIYLLFFLRDLFAFSGQGTMWILFFGYAGNNSSFLSKIPGIRNPASCISSFPYRTPQIPHPVSQIAYHFKNLFDFK